MRIGAPESLRLFPAFDYDPACEFEAHLSAGHVRLPRRVSGFRFKTLAPNAAQTYRERGRKRDKTIRFDYVVPNG